MSRAFTPGDALLAAGVLALAVVLAAGPLAKPARGTASEVVVEVNGAEVMRVPLDAGPAEYQVEGFQGASRFRVEGGEVWMVDSACPDKLCVGMGRARKPGQAIVCLPNRVTLRLEGEGGVDAVQR